MVLAGCRPLQFFLGVVLNLCYLLIPPRFLQYNNLRFQRWWFLLHVCCYWTSCGLPICISPNEYLFRLPGCWSRGAFVLFHKKKKSWWILRGCDFFYRKNKEIWFLSVHLTHPYLKMSIIHSRKMNLVSVKKMNLVLQCAAPMGFGVFKTHNFF